jgi:hypothetical protein
MDNKKPGQGEREHYSVIEDIYQAVVGKRDFVGLEDRLKQMLEAWDRMTGNRFGISSMIHEYITAVSYGEKDSARKLYCLISPFLYFIGALREVSRKSFRNTVTQCGMFCERIVRNILQELPTGNGVNMYEELKERDFEQKAGRVKGELNHRGFESADSLYNSLKNIYFVRNRRGPHDVPPPEPIQARICLTESLPVYIDYVTALSSIGIAISEIDFTKFVDLFYALTEMKPSLVAGPEAEQPSVDALIEELFKQGFFSEERNLAAVMDKLQQMRYNYPKSTVANTLKRLCGERNGFLSRRTSADGYVYSEKVPPSEAFKMVF